MAWPHQSSGCTHWPAADGCTPSHSAMHQLPHCRKKCQQLTAPGCSSNCTSSPGGRAVLPGPPCQHTHPSQPLHSSSAIPPPPTPTPTQPSPHHALSPSSSTCTGNTSRACSAVMQPMSALAPVYNTAPATSHHIAAKHTRVIWTLLAWPLACTEGCPATMHSSTSHSRWGSSGLLAQQTRAAEVP